MNSSALNRRALLRNSALAGVGYTALYSAAGGAPEPYAARHALRFGVGLILMLGIAAIEHRERPVLRGLDVRLVERVDAEQRARHGGRELPAEELLPELVGRGQPHLVPLAVGALGGLRRGGNQTLALLARGLRVACDVQPVPGPAFAEARGVEELREELWPRVGRSVLQKSVHGLGRRRDAVQVEISATDERARVGRRSELAGRGFGEEEAVERRVISN